MVAAESEKTPKVVRGARAWAEREKTPEVVRAARGTAAAVAAATAAPPQADTSQHQ